MAGREGRSKGVEVYPGFSAARCCTARDHQRFEGEPGMELLQADFQGARGSCSEEVMAIFDLGSTASRGGLGVKGWEIPEEKCQPGLVQHTASDTYGGSFLNVLDYANPHLSPIQGIPKTHTAMKHLEGGDCVAYAARVINEGGRNRCPVDLSRRCLDRLLERAKIKGRHGHEDQACSPPKMFLRLSRPRNGKRSATRSLPGPGSTTSSMKCRILSQPLKNGACSAASRMRVLLGAEINRFAAIPRPCWLRRAARNRHRHAIEQTARRWRGGRRERAVKF